ncbi:uncharacterized protein LOC116302256 [Actinia tenebrosa]|uniref:Uncharacterized protein LOC116302256 n=1 Tax=Actinia tenebrosa TaxID=6105 RepID=A0A6P8ILR5_ACTTE|nr:uncharacterized protein LOC116302256 [Actinia tenebrosa]
MSTDSTTMASTSSWSASSVTVTTPLTASSTPKPKSSAIEIITKTSTPQLRFQDDFKSNAESLKDSSFSSGKKGIVIIVIPAVCLLIGVVLLIIIIYQCRIRRTRRTRSRANNSMRDTEAADRSVMNSKYERETVLLNAPNEAATTLNIGDASRMHQALSRDTPKYEDIECEKLNKAIANRNSKNSEAKKSGSVEEGPDTNNGMPEDQPTSESRESESVKDSGPNPLYHVLEGPGPNNVGLAEFEDPTYEDVD